MFTKPPFLSLILAIATAVRRRIAAFYIIEKDTTLLTGRHHPDIPMDQRSVMH